VRRVRNFLSSVRTWETFATESLRRPVLPAERSTLPGAEARFRFVVRATTTTVAILLG
jgi:hypothetical protein